MIPYGRQSVDEADIRAVVQVLRSDWLTGGPKVEAFEKALAEYGGARHAVAVSSGTAALHVAMRAARVGPGDRVITSPITFLASANCAEFVGASVDFVDIDARTYNLDPRQLEADRRPVRAIVAVDFAGQPCPMPRIAAIARRRNALVIEDACHAIGSRFRHRGRWHKVGGHPWADLTAFSFHPVKTMTCGEGGAVLTDSDELAERCRLVRNHGMVRHPEVGPWYYEMQEVGYNYRLTDLQCALGLSQLGKLDRFAARRAEIVRAYNRALGSWPHVKTPRTATYCSATNSVAWHLYVVRIDFAAIGKTRAEVMTALREQGVGTQVHYIPVHLQPYYARKYGYARGKCPVAEAYYEQCLSLPLYPAMSDADVRKVVKALRRVAGGKAH